MPNSEPTKYSVDAQLRRLLPTPRTINAAGSSVSLPPRMRLDSALPRTELPSLNTSRKRFDAQRCLLITEGQAAEAPAVLHLNLTQPPSQAPDLPSIAQQSYELSIASDHEQPDQLGSISIVASSLVGVSYGLATLNQLLLHADGRLPVVHIRDEPRWAIRGVSYDVSRGRVPTLATLCDFVDRMAALKINHLQLYMEHTFAFGFDPLISADASPLTPDELRELDAYCAARHITLAPSLGLCGHMGRILSLPHYAHLAEIPAEKDWWSQSWDERVRGLTLDVTQPEAHQLVERMLDDCLPIFSGPLVNLGCDESWDMGKGRGAQAAAQRGTATLYCEHLVRLATIAERHGKQPLFWGDMLKKMPDSLSGLPADWTPVNWDYLADGDYDGLAHFSHFDQRWVAPGTHTWNRFIADINTAEINVRRHIAAAEAHGATGVLMTDWGDHGHVAPPACAWPGIAMAANLSWNPDGIVGAEFDSAYVETVLQWHTRRLMSHWREAVAICDKPRVWPRFYCLDQTANAIENAEEFDQDEWLASIAAAEAAHRAVPTTADSKPRDWEQLELALALQLHTLAMRWEWLRRPENATAPERAPFAEELSVWTNAYAQTWLARHKPAQLDEVLDAVRQVAVAAQS